MDAACRQKTAPWVRFSHGKGKKNQDAENVGGAEETDVQVLWEREQQRAGDAAAAIASTTTTTTTTTKAHTEHPPALCSFYEDFMENPSAASFVPVGVYTLDELQQLGREKGWCPYFMARHLIELANIVVYNFQYLLDPKVANLVSKELAKDSIVVFDESHNVDSVCIEALSVNFNHRSLDLALTRVGQLRTKVNSAKQSDRERLTREYQSLVRGLQESGAVPAAPSNALVAVGETGGSTLGNPVLPDEILNEAIPGTIRKAESFVQLLSQIVVYLKQKMDQTNETVVETPIQWLHDLETKLAVESRPLRFAHARLDSLMKTLQIVDLDEYSTVGLVCDFLTLVSTYKEGFSVILEPFDKRLASIRNPILQLACLDASIAIKPVFNRFETVIITSGTLSPLELYPKLLDFKPIVSKSLNMSITRPCIFPIIVTRGSDQTPISSSYELRQQASTNRNFGQLLIDMSANVPDGIVCFFTAYEVLEQTVSDWDSTGILAKILENKLIFIETKDVVETTLALDNYRRACDCGRGAVFLSVARGKVSEGIDFEKQYGRAVVLCGIPFQYTKSVVLTQRLEYLRRKFEIRESDFLTFDAIRSASQCLGRVLRSKQDWGIMVLADNRYNSHSKRSKLPPWITQFLKDENTNLSIDEAMTKINGFLKEIAQPLPLVPVSSSGSLLTADKLLDEGDVERWEGARKSEEEASKRLKATAAVW